MGGVCCKGSDSLDDLSSGRSRACTDIFCLLLFIATMGSLVALSIVAMQREPDLLNDLVYPKDSYGNNCGRPNTAVSGMPKVFYPNLDADILSQLAIVTTGQWWRFTPTRMCTAACPAGFSLKNPISYGGPSYPVAASISGTAASYWYAYETQDVVDRCFPKDTSGATKVSAHALPALLFRFEPGPPPALAGHRALLRPLLHQHHTQCEPKRIGTMRGRACPT